MSTGSQLGIAARPGYATETQCVILVTSLSNESATLRCDGSSYSITWNAVGEDRGSGPTNAGYVDHITVTGLSAFTQYTYTVTQGSNIVIGSFYTLPSDSDDFCFWFVNCDANVSGLCDYSTAKTGMYRQIQEWTENNSLPCVGLLHVDDLHGYPDLHVVDDSASTGHSTTGVASVTTREYDYAISYQCAYGLLGDSNQDSVTWGWDTHRVWCMQNLNLWPQWGDHEFEDDLGWDVDNTVPTAAYTAGKAVWDDFMAPLQPPAIDGVNSNAWGFALGGIKIIAPDGVTNGDAGIAPNKVIYGATQIANIKSAITTDEPFKILTLEKGIRYLDATQHEFKSGTQHPIYDGALAEYQSIFTNTTDGLMSNNKTNGTFGTMLTLHGDYHRGLVLKNEKTAYAGNDAEWFYSVHNGTVNGSLNFDVDGDVGGTTIQEGLTFDGSTIEYLQDSGTYTYVGNPHKHHATRIEYYGSSYPKELRIIVVNQDGEEVYNKKFVHQRTGNENVDPSVNVDFKESKVYSGE